MGYTVPLFSPAGSTAARMNLAPLAPADPTPASLRGTGFTPAPTASAKIGNALWARAQPPPLGGGGWVPQSTGSNTGGPGPNPGASGAPAALPSQFPTLATLSPGVRTLLKLIPVGAAVYFFAKGETALGGASAAAAVGAWMVL